MSKISIELSTEAAIVLLRCLDYGEIAISRKEHKARTGKIVCDNVAVIRSDIQKQLIQNMKEQFLEKA